MLTRSLSVLHAAAIVVGVMVGIGIFRTPTVVAANVSSEAAFIGLWFLGGVVTIIGALSYAELGSTYPNAGGEYHFLRKAYGNELGFLFGWGRMVVMQSGSIAAVAFVYGDYFSVLIPAGVNGSAIYAMFAVVLLSVLQLIGTRLSGRAQIALTAATLVVVLFVAVAGLSVAPVQPPSQILGTGGATGLAMVFVLLTYGGWSEAAYVSEEVHDAKRNIPCALLLGTATVMVLYAFANVAYLKALGLEGLRQSKSPAADIVRLALGAKGEAVVAGIISVASLSTLNATILTGARSIYALGRNFPPFAVLGRSGKGGRAPRAAILAQAGIVMVLIALGGFTRRGFESMIEYTAPVFWTFMLLVGVSLFVFRWSNPERSRPFSVPLYPATPLLFCATSAYLLYASLVHTGIGGLLGIAILATGIPIYRVGRRGTAKRKFVRSGGHNS